ncbi:MAG: hypothetical protein D6820_08650, partial [Lentisphaerae bacterium]
MGNSKFTDSVPSWTKRLAFAAVIATVAITAWLIYPREQRDKLAFKGRVIFVNPHAAKKGDGSSWQSPLHDLQTAIDIARPGDQLWLTEGIYKADKNGFRLKQGIQLLGGFAGNETSVEQRSVTENRTILTTADSSTKTLVGAANAIVDGVSVAGEVEPRGAVIINAAAGIVGTITIKYEGITTAPAISAYTNTAAEVTSVTTTADAGGSLDNTHFRIYDQRGAVNVWIDVDGDMVGTPTISAGERLLMVTTIESNDDAATVASKVAAAINADSSFTATSSSNVVTITANQKGDLTDASDVDTGFTVAVTTQGAAVAHTVTFSGGEATISIDDSVGTDVTLVAPWTSGSYNFGSWRYENGERITPFNKLNLTVTGNLTVVAAYGQVIYVDGTSGDDSNSGVGGWANAVKTLQRGLDIAAARNNRNDEIWVRAGTYVPTQATSSTDSSSKTFKLSENQALYGGFAGTETSREQRIFTTVDGRKQMLNSTVLDGQGACYHVVTTADNTIIDGFVITGGNAGGSVYPDNRGGGMLCMAGTPVIRNCMFTDNTAAAYGGAVYIFVASPHFEECLFGTSSGLVNGNTATRNTAGSKGGAIYCDKRSVPSFKYCSFIGNSAGSGAAGAYWDTELKMLVTNGDPGFGSAVYNFGGAPSFESCFFRANNPVPYGDGGAVYNDGTNTTGVAPSFNNCEFFDNRVTPRIIYRGMTTDSDGITHGGDIYVAPTYGSISYGLGGAVYNNNSSPSFTNCSFGGNTYGANTSLRHGGAIYNT